MLVAGATFGGYGVFMLAMGTTTPLVVVTSGSMVPTLSRGDMLVLQSRPADQILVNDIVVYNAEWYTAAPVVHRVVEIEIVDGEYRYYTKGDANLARDADYRTYDDIVGVVVLIIPQVGHVSLFLQTTEGKIVAVGIFLAIIILPELFCKESPKEESAASEPEMQLGTSTNQSP